MKDSELIEIEGGSEEPSKNFDGSSEAESTGAENSGEEKAEEEKTVEEEDKVEEENVTSRWHAAKVGIFDISLYSADVVTDGVQVVTHYFNCHKIWAQATGLFVLLPAITESVGIFVDWIQWVWKDFKFRGPFALLFLAFFTGLFKRVGKYWIENVLHETPPFGFWRETEMGFITGCIVVVIAVFFASTTSTLKGYAALMAKQPNPDGSVSNPKMLDGIKGKLKEVILEAGPQSNLQVKFPINILN